MVYRSLKELALQNNVRLYKPEGVGTSGLYERVLRGTGVGTVSQNKVKGLTEMVFKVVIVYSTVQVLYICFWQSHV